MIQTRLVSNFWWHRDQICSFRQPFANIICESATAHTYWLFRSMAEHFVVGNMRMIFDAGFSRRRHSIFSMLSVLGIFLSWLWTCNAFAGSCLCLKGCLISTISLFSKNCLKHDEQRLQHILLFQVVWCLGMEVTLQDPRFPNPDSSRLCIHHSICWMASCCIALGYIEKYHLIYELKEPWTLRLNMESCPGTRLVHVLYCQFASQVARGHEKQIDLWSLNMFGFPFFTSQFDFSMLPVSSDSFWINCWAERTAS